jgi:hypothetical protein
MSESTVYIPQRPSTSGRGWTPDMSKAEKYGKIKYIFDLEDHKILTESPTAAIVRAIKALENYDAERDYIAWPPASPLALIVVIMAIMAMGKDSVQYLSWDRTKDPSTGERSGGMYIPITYSVKKVEDLLGWS